MVELLDSEGHKIFRIVSFPPPKTSKAAEGCWWRYLLCV